MADSSDSIRLAVMLSPNEIKRVVACMDYGIQQVYKDVDLYTLGSLERSEANNKHVDWGILKRRIFETKTN